MATRNSDIQGQKLEVTVLCCVRLKDTNAITKQNPFVQLQYGDKERRTVTSKKGGVNPSFGDKFEFKLIEGMQNLKVSVHNERTMSKPVLIGSGKIKIQGVLEKVFLKGCSEEICYLFNENMAAGEVRLMLTCPNVNRPYSYGASSSSSVYQTHYVPQPSPSHQHYRHY